MLYLIKSAGYDRKTNKYIDLLKVGFAKNVNKRYSSYVAHNPTCVLLKSIPGSLNDEALLHYKFRRYRYDGYGVEWYYYSDEIVDYFLNFSEGAENLLGDIPTLSKKDISDLCKYIDRVIERYCVLHHISGLDEYKLIRLKTQCIYDNIKKNIFSVEDINFELKKQLGEVDSDVFNLSIEDRFVSDIVDEFYKYKDFSDRLKYLMNLGLSGAVAEKVLSYLPYNFSRYFSLGLEKCASHSYRRNGIEKDICKIENNSLVKDTLDKEIYKAFNVGEKYKKSDIKAVLKGIYACIEYQATPKATDLEEYFELRSCQITNSETGKIDNGFEIIKKR